MFLCFLGIGSHLFGGQEERRAWVPAAAVANAAVVRVAVVVHEDDRGKRARGVLQKSRGGQLCDAPKKECLLLRRKGELEPEPLRSPRRQGQPSAYYYS